MALLIPDRWSWLDEYSVVDAAALIAGYDPVHVVYHDHYSARSLLGEDEDNQTVTCFKAMRQSIENKSLPAALIYDEFEIAWSLTTVHKTDLIQWLESKRQYPPFFFPDRKIDGASDSGNSAEDNQALSSGDLGFEPVLLLRLAIDYIKELEADGYKYGDLDRWLKQDAIVRDLVNKYGLSEVKARAVEAVISPRGIR